MSNLNVYQRLRDRPRWDDDPCGVWTLCAAVFVTRTPEVRDRWYEMAARLDVEALATLLQHETPPLVDEIQTPWMHELMTAAVLRCNWLALADSLRQEAGQ